MRKELFRNEITILKDTFRRLLRRRAKTNIIKLINPYNNELVYLSTNNNSYNYGNNIKVLLVSSTLIGATITLMSDQFARLILSPSEMPIGLATTILGAPVMMLLAFKIR